MDSLTLAATSLIIAISLMITGRKLSYLRVAFVGLCLAIFVSQTGFILYHYLARDFWKNVGHIGMLAVVPFAQFFRLLTHNRSMLTRGIVEAWRCDDKFSRIIFNIYLLWLAAVFLHIRSGIRLCRTGDLLLCNHALCKETVARR